MKYPELFQPFDIGRLRIKNRVVMSAMHTVGWMDRFDTYTDRVIDYYEARAKGGVGLIYTGAMYPDYTIEGSETGTGSVFGAVSAMRAPDNFKYQSRKLSDRVHSYGTRIFAQFNYGSGRVQFPAAARKNAVAVSEGPTLWDPSIICRPLTKKEITGMVDATVDAARICKDAGFDGVDIVAQSGYMLSEFLTPVFNNRDDEYGGDIYGRTKVLTDMISGIKAECGRDFPVSVRMSTKHYMKGVGKGALEGDVYDEVGIDTDEALKIALILEKAGLDVLYVSNGCYDAMAWQYPPMYQKEGLWLDDVAPVTKNIGIPVISAGKILTPSLAADAVGSGKVTAVALGRQLLADPEWANKAKRGEDEDIRPCIGCNIGCLGNIFAGRPMRCAVNADLFCEGEHLEAAERGMKVAVIGGGIAGMECARTAAMRGFETDIYESSDELGGVALAAEVPDFKTADRRLIKWFRRQIEKLGVKVHFGTRMTADDICALDADEIVVSTGASPKIPPIPGVDLEKCMLAVDALLHEEKVGENVIVLGGGVTGCEIAVWLAEKKHKVTIVESLSDIMAIPETRPFYSNVMMLRDLLERDGVEIRTGAMCREISEDRVTVEGSSGTYDIENDTVVLCTGFRADSKLFEEVYEKSDKKVWCIGDARHYANILNAVTDGHTVGKSL